MPKAKSDKDVRRLWMTLARRKSLVEAANRQSGDISILLARDDGDFAPAIRYEAVGDSPRSIVTADFNDDGRPDLAVANARSDDVLLLLGLGDGTFRDGPRIDVGQSPWSLVVGDFDGDGKNNDLATADRDSSTVSIWNWNGDLSGPFDVESTLLGKSPLGEARFPVVLVTDDFDGNGRQDLATGNRLSGDVAILRAFDVDDGFSPDSW